MERNDDQSIQMSPSRQVAPQMRDHQTDGVAISTSESNPIVKFKRWIAHRSRQKRAALFDRLFPGSDLAKIVDLGGGRGTHFHTHYPEKKNVCIADYNKSDLDYASKQFGYKPLHVDGTAILPVASGEFDIVFCSSVVEHVTGPKAEAVERFKRSGREFVAEAWPYQAQFAREISRIGKGYFVQTPCKTFPVEVHSWIPFLGYFPTHLQWKIITVFNRFWPRKNHEADWSLLTADKVRQLFPGAEIHREKFLGITKSIIAVRRLAPPDATRTSA